MKSLTDIERHEAEALQTEARRLCRAAPDLRDALEEIMAAFRNIVSYQVSGDKAEVRRVRNAWTKAEAALAKSREPVPAPEEIIR